MTNVSDLVLKAPCYYSEANQTPTFINTLLLLRIGGTNTKGEEKKSPREKKKVVSAL